MEGTGAGAEESVTDQSSEGPTTSLPPTSVFESEDTTSTDAAGADKFDLSTVMSFTNETTTPSPADESSSSANTTTTTARPSFPSLEGLDYRMSEYLHAETIINE